MIMVTNTKDEISKNKQLSESYGESWDTSLDLKALYNFISHQKHLKVWSDMDREPMKGS